MDKTIGEVKANMLVAIFVKYNTMRLKITDVG